MGRKADEKCLEKCSEVVQRRIMESEKWIRLCGVEAGLWWGRSVEWLLLSNHSVKHGFNGVLQIPA